MKKVMLSVTMIALSMIGFAQSEFETCMKANIDSLYQSFASGKLQEPVNRFERYAQMDTARWEPLYYAAYGYCMMSYRAKDDAQKDALADKGQELLNKAFQIAPKESELFVLQGFLYNMKLLVSPMMRGSKYMNLIHESYTVAEKLDSLNPRTYYMRAQMIMYSPAFIGGGKDKALPIFLKAKQKFDTFTSSNILAPRWGKNDCLKKIEECSK